MNAITPFEFEDSLVRVTEINGEPWFVARDVCAVLGVKNHRDTVSRLDADEYAKHALGHSRTKGLASSDTPDGRGVGNTSGGRGVGNADPLDEKGVHTVGTLGGVQEMLIVSESGMYALVFKSRKPAAKRFRKWVTSEVLPSIRKTGKYQEPTQRVDRTYLPVDAGVWLSAIREARMLKGDFAATALWDASPLPPLPDTPPPPPTPQPEKSALETAFHVFRKAPPVPAMTMRQISDYLTVRCDDAFSDADLLPLLRKHSTDYRTVNIGARYGGPRRLWVFSERRLQNTEISQFQKEYDPEIASGPRRKGAA